MSDELMRIEHEAQLDLIAQALAARDVETQLLAAGDELPVSTLMVGLGTDRTLAVSIMPFSTDDLGATQLVQFYVQLAAVDAEHLASVQQAAAIINGAIAIGHFGTQAEQLFYRYVLAMPASQTFDVDMVIELIGLLSFHQEHFGDYFDGIIEGEIAVSILPDLLTQTA